MPLSPCPDPRRRLYERRIHFEGFFRDVKRYRGIHPQSTQEPA
jgi:transposase